jgi:4-diphosphocytidyl-2-C-methyl-D-erythritol kinase
MTIIREFAPAKLNLYLHVLGRDQRGYHLLDSLVVFADIGDELSVTPSAGFSLSIDGPFGQGLECDSSNLVWKAAHMLAAATGHAPDVAVTLTKTLPVASGIGGGSSDAGAMLRALCTLWGLDPASAAVMGVAAMLGSDVPVCVPARSCFMGGVGEALDACPPLPRMAIVLANPGFPLPTKDVFAARQGAFAPEGRFDITPRDAAQLVHILGSRDNGLTAAALSLKPEIATVLDALGQCDGCLLPRMLGSGATCLGLFHTDRAAEAAAAKLSASYPGWWVKAGHFGGEPGEGA